MASSSASLEVPGHLGLGRSEELRRRLQNVPPPPPEHAWRDEFRAVEGQWEQMRLALKRPVSVPILRVNQYDAVRLDLEMAGMLKEQLMKVFSLSQPGLLSRYEPELNAFLGALIWRFSIWVDRPTPGNALMNLRYRDERGYHILAAAGKVRTGLEGPGLTKFQKICYCLAMVGCRYGLARLQMFSAFQRWGDGAQNSWTRWAWGLVQKLEKVCNVANFLNHLVFLYSGRYPTLVERLLRARLVYERPTMNRAVSFEYMNRQLVWHEFSELLLLFLPLLNVLSMRKLAFPFLNGHSSVANLPEDACPICEERHIAVTVAALPCGHLYCYYCLRTRCIANSSYRCVRCNAGILAMRRHHQAVSIPRSESELMRPAVG